MLIKKYFFLILLSFSFLSQLHTQPILSLQKTRGQIIHNLDSLYDLQNYYNHETAREETLLGRCKHKLDHYCFKKDFSLETLVKYQSYISQEIKRLSTELAHIDKALNDPTYELNFDENKDEAINIKLPSLLERQSAKIYTLTALTLVLVSYILYKPQTIPHIKTASSSLIDIWKKSIDSLKILLGVKKNSITDLPEYENLTEKLKQLTTDLDKNNKELSEALSQLSDLNTLALIINNPEDITKTIQEIREGKPIWLIPGGIYDQLLKSLQNSEIISSESLAESKIIIKKCVDAMTKRTTNLSETVAVYQQIARNLLHLAYALIPISCSILGFIGTRKACDTIKHNKFATINDHLMEHFIITTDDSIMSDAHYGQLLYWTDKLECLKKSWTLSIKERIKLTTLLSYLRNSTIAPQQKAELLSRYTLI